jgi:hypothetical protein
MQFPFLIITLNYKFLKAFHIFETINHRTPVRFSSTKCIVHSGFVVNLNCVALIGHRQICRFDYFKGGKFGSLGDLKIIALKSATKPYIDR